MKMDCGKVDTEDGLVRYAFKRRRGLRARKEVGTGAESSGWQWGTATSMIFVAVSVFFRADL